MLEIAANAQLDAREGLPPDDGFSTKIDVSGEITRQFIRQCSQLPGAVALVDAHDSWTYEEAFTAALQLGEVLARRGVCEDDVVVVIGDRCATFVISLLSVLLAGARFVVLDRGQLTRHSVDTLAKLRPRCWIAPGQNRRDGGASVEDAMDDEILANLIRVPYGRSQLHQLLDELSREASSNGADEGLDLPKCVGEHARAYLIWTSGTTNLPKLISTRHASVVNFLEWYVDEFRLDAHDSFSLLSGLAHDPVLRDIFAPLSVGATLRIPSDSQRLDPDALHAWVASSAVTIIHLTPAMIELLARAQRCEPVASVRLLAFGGDQLTARHIAIAQRLFPNAQVVNFYGASETPQAMAFHRVRGGNTRDDAPGAIPVGHGVRGAQLLVLTDDLQLCGVAQPGEIYVRSPYLSEGYIGLGELTRQRFIANPLTADPGDRVFRTGDVGVYESDGAVRLIGRRDRQAKVNGNRIDLDEIEIAIAGFEAVAQAAVTLEAVSSQIAAYVVPQKAEEFSEIALRKYLASRGPLQAMPARIEIIDTLPITRNGKTDYARLESAARGRGAAQIQHRAGRLQEALRNVWMSELGVADIAATQSFYDLGGDSIAALKIAERISGEMQVQLRAADLFIYPTLAALENFLLQGSSLADLASAGMQVETAQRRNAVLRARSRRRRMSG